ncbi:MAG TPA: hypothetical protein VK172_10410 [Lentimicrobium sp.]|nr:hypothetical protein [Lentimicrobium sp.]
MLYTIPIQPALSGETPDDPHIAVGLSTIRGLVLSPSRQRLAILVALEGLEPT